LFSGKFSLKRPVRFVHSVTYSIIKRFVWWRNPPDRVPCCWFLTNSPIPISRVLFFCQSKH
jgi:hypothetical protein